MPIAIVTGASRGLGLALTRALAEDGWSVVADARGAGDLRAALDGVDGVTAIPGDVNDPAHRRALVAAAGERIDLLVNNAGTLGPSPLPRLEQLALDAATDLFRTNVIAPLALIQVALPRLADGARIVNVTSDAAVEPYPTWGGYGASKAALEQLTAILGAEHPELRVYAVDPGEMRTRMHQDAFPGEDISDRPLPEASVPGLLALVAGAAPSGRYSAHEVAPATT